MDFKEEACIIIKQYRAKKGLTQGQFAKIAKISTRSVAQIEIKKHVRDKTLNIALEVTGYELETSKRVVKM